MYERRPRYLSVYEKMKSDILSGKYERGKFLPSEEALQKEFDASRTTVRHALSLLKKEGLVVSRQGQGTSVMASDLQLADYQYHRYQKLLSANSFYPGGERHIYTQGGSVTLVMADEGISQSLRIEKGSACYQIYRTKMYEEMVLSYVVSFVPTALAPGLEKYSGEIPFLYNLLKEQFGLVQTSGEEFVSAISADSLQSALFGISPNQPLLKLRRITRAGDTPFEYCETVTRPDLWQLQINFGEAGIPED